MIITISIIVLNVIISLMAFNNEALFNKLCFYPYVMNRDKGQFFRFISGGFVHADMPHLLFNMLTLFFFGTELERIFGQTLYLIFYFSALILSSLPEFQKQKNNRGYTACGASGAVSGILFALVLYRPWGVIYIKFIIPVYFILFAIFYVGYSWYRAKNQTDNIGHGVHLWGALYGLAFTLLMEPSSFSTFMAQVTHPPFLN